MFVVLAKFLDFVAVRHRVRERLSLLCLLRHLFLNLHFPAISFVVRALVKSGAGKSVEDDVTTTCSDPVEDTLLPTLKEDGDSCEPGEAANAHRDFGLLFARCCKRLVRTWALKGHLHWERPPLL